MTPTTLRVLAMASALGTAAAMGQPNGFCDKIKALTVDPSVAAAHWGVSVTTLDGTVLCEVNSAQLFRPASNNKLFTGVAALALLGPERHFTTSIVADGEIAGGILRGNLRLAGGGDPSFGSLDLPFIAPAKRARPTPLEPATIADIEELADQVVAKGVKTIEGNIVGDDTYFAWEPYPRAWGIDDLLPGYGAPVSALTIHDSELEIDVIPGAKPGTPATATITPGVPYYAFDNFVTTVAETPQHSARLTLDRALGSRLISISGEVETGMVKKQTVAIHDPAEYAALALKLALERRGITIGGSPVPLHGPALKSTAPKGEADTTVKKVLDDPIGFHPACPAPEPSPRRQTVLATHQSARLMDDLTYTEKESQNLHAEVLMRNIGATCSCEHTQASGLALVKAYLAQIGIASGDLVLFDGSGLSAQDLVTPRSLTALLVFASKQPWFAEFKASLPLGGVDGTLASRFTAPASSLTGKVFAKTGTLGESRDLSGYLTTSAGQTLVFSVLVDNHPPTGGADRVAMDKIVEAIAVR